MDILSADSMLVYRGLDIGTAKPTAEERGQVVYRGMDLGDPETEFSTGKYLEAAGKAFQDTERMQIVVGGTGLYVKGLIEGLDADGPPDPAIRASVQALLEREGLGTLQERLREEYPERWEQLADPQNPRRVCRALEQALAGTVFGQEGDRPPAVIVGLSMPPPVLVDRIEQRVKTMYEGGLLEEVEALMARPAGFSVTAAGAIGYAEAMAIIHGKLSRDDAMSQTTARTRRLAKRQRTWFRHQANVQWIEAEGRSLAQIAGDVRATWQKTGPTPVRCAYE